MDSENEAIDVVPSTGRKVVNLFTLESHVFVYLRAEESSPVTQIKEMQLEGAHCGLSSFVCLLVLLSSPPSLFFFFLDLLG